MECGFEKKRRLDCHDVAPSWAVLACRGTSLSRTKSHLSKTNSKLVVEVEMVHV